MGGAVRGLLVVPLVVLRVVLARMLATQAAVLPGVWLETDPASYCGPDTNPPVRGCEDSLSGLGVVDSGAPPLLLVESSLRATVNGLSLVSRVWEAEECLGAWVGGAVWDGGVAVRVGGAVGLGVLEVNSGKGVKGLKAKSEIFSLGPRVWGGRGEAGLSRAVKGSNRTNLALLFAWLA